MMELTSCWPIPLLTVILELMSIETHHLSSTGR